ncbi:MAG: endonuclease domain-containing protein [Candidatus Cyclonatronum sp.]|uniref:endonuclease domain-containing protein n=1 Tax=Cyclonatronum sp. TaxID=3024185 RepID=UPI0025BC4AE7|nr:DUF559 domain-containing protein [Cyclonatronum sp.]MCH8485436.1 endonuclease domain-containing protein [Cyclonatronum sp.]
MKPFSKKLRNESTLSEVLFWNRVKRGQFYNIDFDRQQNIGPYIVDFYAKQLGVVIEIDGYSHAHKGEYDSARTAYLESLDLYVYSIRDVKIRKRLNEEMMKLAEFIIMNFGISSDGNWLHDDSLRARGGEL